MQGQSPFALEGDRPSNRLAVESLLGDNAQAFLANPEANAILAIGFSQRQLNC